AAVAAGDRAVRADGRGRSRDRRRDSRSDQCRACPHDPGLHPAVRHRAPLLRAVPVDDLDVVDVVARVGLLAYAPEAPGPASQLPGHYHPYVLIKLASAAQLFLMRQYFLTIPRDLEEAAKLDGAGYFKTFWKVMLPLAGPALAAVAILEFEGAWNDFFWPLIIFSTAPSHYTLPVGIFSFVSTYQMNYPPLMASSVIAIAPIAVLYVFFQRYFVAGVAS